MKKNCHSYTMRHRMISSLLSALIIVSFMLSVQTNSALALDVPHLIHPENQTTTTPLTDPPLALPAFTWSAVTGANVYRLQIDTDTAFAPPIMDITTRNTSFTLSSTGNIFPDGDVYWRVRVDDPAGENWSMIFRFTKTWATIDNTPILVAPDDGAYISFFNYPIFSWEPATGSPKYRFQIALSPDGFNSPIFQLDTLATTIQPNIRFENKDYYWRVVPMNPVDTLGTPSQVRRFTMAYGYGEMKPILIEPENLAHPTFTPTFSWVPIIGADYYRLEYSSDDINCGFPPGSTTSIVTRQTSYTPTYTFPNDKFYCWRVRVESGSALGDWSDNWIFQKQWYLQPVLLTPENLQQVPYPIFNWKPVPGAARYEIQVSDNPSFNGFYGYTTTRLTFSQFGGYYDTPRHLYWRVRPFDTSGNSGIWSAVREFDVNPNLLVPTLVYPYYFYIQDDYEEYKVAPYEDRTIAYPIFIWHHVMNPPANGGGIFASAYRIQVDTSDNFTDPVWIFDTKNTIATPLNDDFIPLVGQDYFWRVCVLDHLGGDCLVGPNYGYSRPWKARFDASLALPPTSGNGPELLRPAIADESVESTPLFEWWPYQGATQYRIEVSQDPEFVNPVISDLVKYPAFTYDDLLAENIPGLANFGTYYWRVQAYVNEVWGPWSETWRFQLASQSDWKVNRQTGSNQVLIGDDPVGDIITPTYDLSTLYAAQSNGYWFFGFDANLTPEDTSFVIYLDLDNEDNSGATFPPDNTIVETIPAHQPEFAIIVNKVGGVIDADHSWVYAWTGSSWDGDPFSGILHTEIISDSGYVEMQLPNAAIGMDERTSRASLILFSVNPNTHVVQDSVPSDPKVPEIPGNTPILSRFSTVSDHMNMIYPPNNTSGDPKNFTSIPPFFWEWPNGSDGITPYMGAVLEVALDPLFTNVVRTYYTSCATAYHCENNIYPPNDIIGDNTYYWRIRPSYQGGASGAWSGPWSFHRKGFTPQELTTIVPNSTPTFSWAMAQSGQYYRFEVATDEDFRHVIFSAGTALTTYTPENTLPPGSYYWHVGVQYGDIWNIYSPPETFTFTYLIPTGLTPNGVTVQYTPTFCWEPQLSAARYRLQVSTSEDFSTFYDTIDVFNMCWTPTFSYDDRYNDLSYFWRVAPIDGNGNLGEFSETAIFMKKSPVTDLVSPVNKSVPQTPTFVWTPVTGASTYLFEISTNNQFYPLYDTVETVNVQYTPIWTYQTNQIYYWRVAIRDRNGKLGPYSQATVIIGNASPTYLPVITK